MHLLKSALVLSLLAALPALAATPEKVDESMNPNIGTERPRENLQQKPDTTDRNAPANANSNNRTKTQKLQQRPDDPVPSEPVPTGPGSPK